MFNPFRKEDPQLATAIAQVYEEMDGTDPKSDAYKQMTERLKDLNDLKNKGVDPNQVLVIVGNIMIAMAVIQHEQTSVIATRLMPFLTKR